MSEPKLGWETGTVKEKTYSESQAELINDLQAKVYSREIENKRMREALEAIKKHLEFSCPSGYKMSAVWNIANEALNNG